MQKKLAIKIAALFFIGSVYAGQSFMDSARRALGLTSKCHKACENDPSPTECKKVCTPEVNRCVDENANAKGITDAQLRELVVECVQQANERKLAEKKKHEEELAAWKRSSKNPANMSPQERTSAYNKDHPKTFAEINRSKVKQGRHARYNS